MTYEYKTTSAPFGAWKRPADAYDNVVKEFLPPDPAVPEGSGWELHGTCANGERLFWTWRRAVLEQAEIKNHVPHDWPVPRRPA